MRRIMPLSYQKKRKNTKASPGKASEPEDAADNATVIVERSVDSVRRCCTPKEALKVGPGVVVRGYAYITYVYVKK